MTREEAVEPLAMLKANWNFLDFSDPVTAGVWMTALEPYHVAEVRQGVHDAIANIAHTPSVAEVLEFVRAVHEGTRRRKAEEESYRKADREIRCRKCNDHGFINIIYPTGYDAVRPCDCEQANRQFGSEALRYISNMPNKDDMNFVAFGANEIPGQYKLVRKSRVLKPTGEKWRDPSGKTVEIMKYEYVDFTGQSYPDEEVFMAYEKQWRANNGKERLHQND